MRRVVLSRDSVGRCIIHYDITQATLIHSKIVVGGLKCRFHLLYAKLTKCEINVTCTVMNVFGTVRRTIQYSKLCRSKSFRCIEMSDLTVIKHPVRNLSSTELLFTLGAVGGIRKRS